MNRQRIESGIDPLALGATYDERQPMRCKAELQHIPQRIVLGSGTSLVLTVLSDVMDEQ